MFCLDRVDRGATTLSITTLTIKGLYVRHTSVVMLNVVFYLLKC